MAIASGTRYPALVAEMRRCDAAVFGLNEVSRRSLAVLLESEFIRDGFAVSELPGNPNGTLSGPHGCVIFSRLPGVSCLALGAARHNAGGCREAVIALVDAAPGVRAAGGAPRDVVGVCSLHTVAYQSGANKAKRALQIGMCNDALLVLSGAPSAPAALARLPADVAAAASAGPRVTAGYFITGDLNLHYRNEAAAVLSCGLLDAWAETHFAAAAGFDDNADGFTFDAQRNTMIGRYIPGERRRMRLDRILMSGAACGHAAQLRPAAPCALWGDAAVLPAKDVFLSDHFGLVVPLRRRTGDLDGDAAARAAMERDAALPPEDDDFSKWRFTKAVCGHSAWLTLRALGFK
jgi:hypothetical protein